MFVYYDSSMIADTLYIILETPQKFIMKTRDYHENLKCDFHIVSREDRPNDCCPIYLLSLVNCQLHYILP